VDVDARIEALKGIIDQLREQVLQLEAVLGVTHPVPTAFGFTGQERRLFGVLLKRDVASKDALMAALYRDLGRDEAEIKIIDVFVCKMRRKLRPFEISIHTVWGEGYRLDQETKTRVEALRAGEQAEAA
jgi:two-component system cell cycle response regulator CtrA